MTKALSILLIIALSFAAACASTPTDTADQQEAEYQEVAQRPSPDYSQPPPGFSSAEVLAVLAAPEGPVVLLGSEAREAMLPIFINMSQAMAIELRREGQDFQRPLTHDLLEDMMETLDGEIGKVQVDALQESTFHATIFLITPTEIAEIDARPSDAIALAVGRDIPIYVADEVIDAAGLTEEDIRGLPPADPGDPEDFDDAPTTPL